jgi:hypothetical protein
MRTLILLIALLVQPASAGLITHGARLFVEPGETVSYSLGFSGGSSTSSSPTARIARTGSADVNTFTLEMWLLPDVDGNNRTISEGASYAGAATDGNIIWDADSLDTRGFIIGLSNCRIYLGVNASSAYTLVGTSNLCDGNWHHVAVYRNATSGLMELFADGAREDTYNGPTGSVMYDGDGPVTDSYHYIAKEKLNFTYGYAGLIDEIRISSSQRYSGSTYSVPTGPFSSDASTIAIYHFDEGSGTSAADSSGNGHNAALLQSPTWSAVSPF